ncbi:MAG: BRO family protein [Rhodospirillaceae bacterium]
MSTEIIPFEFEGAAVRGLSIDGEPWFVAKDVAEVLGYANPQKAARDHCKAAQPVGVNVSFTLDPQTVIIPERDMYRLIMRSKLPAAERFEEWVVGEVLPAIRRTGHYGAVASPRPAAGEIPAVLTVPLKEWSAVMSRLIEVQEELIGSLKKSSNSKDFARHEATATLLIQETALTDDEIAERMKGMVGALMPEWVAWQRRKILEAASPS